MMKKLTAALAKMRGNDCCSRSDMQHGSKKPVLVSIAAIQKIPAKSIRDALDIHRECRCSETHHKFGDTPFVVTGPRDDVILIHLNSDPVQK